MAALIMPGGSPVHITMPSGLPMHKVMGNANFVANAYVTNTQFIGFDGPTNCGARQSVIGLNPSGSDFNAPTHFSNCHFEDIRQDSFAYIYDPPSGWANLSDCGEWPCTGPENVLFTFKDTTWSGTTPTHTKRNF